MEDLEALLRKWPDGFALSWSQQRVLEITRAYDADEDWVEFRVTDERRRRRYWPLRKKMSRFLPPAF